MKYFRFAVFVFLCSYCTLFFSPPFSYSSQKDTLPDLLSLPHLKKSSGKPLALKTVGLSGFTRSSPINDPPFSCPALDLRFKYLLQRHTNPKKAACLEFSGKKYRLLYLTVSCKKRSYYSLGVTLPDTSLYPKIFDLLVLRTLILHTLLDPINRPLFKAISRTFSSLQSSIYTYLITNRKALLKKEVVAQTTPVSSSFDVLGPLFTLSRDSILSKNALVPTTSLLQSLRKEYSAVLKILRSSPSSNVICQKLTRLYRQQFTALAFNDGLSSLLNNFSFRIKNPLHVGAPTKTKRLSSKKRRATSRPKHLTLTIGQTSFEIYPLRSFFLFLVFLFIFYIPLFVYLAVFFCSPEIQALRQEAIGLSAQLFDPISSSSEYQQLVARHEKLTAVADMRFDFLFINRVSCFLEHTVAVLYLKTKKSYHALLRERYSFMIKTYRSALDAEQKERALMFSQQEDSFLATAAPFEELHRLLGQLSETTAEDHADFLWYCDNKDAVQALLFAIVPEDPSSLQAIANRLLDSLRLFREKAREEQARQQQRQLAATELEILLARTKALLKKTPYSSQSAIQNTFKELCGVLDGDEKPQRKLKRLKHFRSKEGLA